MAYMDTELIDHAREEIGRLGSSVRALRDCDVAGIPEGPPTRVRLLELYHEVVALSVGLVDDAVEGLVAAGFADQREVLLTVRDAVRARGLWAEARLRNAFRLEEELE